MASRIFKVIGKATLAIAGNPRSTKNIDHQAIFYGQERVNYMSVGDNRVPTGLTAPTLLN